MELKDNKNIETVNIKNIQYRCVIHHRTIFNLTIIINFLENKTVHFFVYINQSNELNELEKSYNLEQLDKDALYDMFINKSEGNVEGYALDIKKELEENHDQLWALQENFNNENKKNIKQLIRNIIKKCLNLYIAFDIDDRLFIEKSKDKHNLPYSPSSTPLIQIDTFSNNKAKDLKPGMIIKCKGDDDNWQEIKEVYTFEECEDVDEGSIAIELDNEIDILNLNTGVKIQQNLSSTNPENQNQQNKPLIERDIKLDTDKIDKIIFTIVTILLFYIIYLIISNIISVLQSA